MKKDVKENIYQEVYSELTGNILPFWMNNMVDNERGGFYGQINHEGTLIPQAPKGAILNARILWTFSAAYRVTGLEDYLLMAQRARDYFVDHFIDREFGGVYWSLDCEGRPLDTKKQIYAIAFAIYGLSEFYRATNEQAALDEAKNLFYIIEKYAFDDQFSGYFEAFTRDWKEIEDMRLSDKDANERKTMNTHLHVLESYTNLYRAWKDPLLEKQLKSLINVFPEKILDAKTSHLNLFFTDDWEVKGDIISYGHDIEASWLIPEAALVSGDKILLERVEPIIQKIGLSTYEGLQCDNSLIYEQDNLTGHSDTDRHWWVQAEAVVGYYNLNQHFGDEEAFHKALGSWDYIKSNLVDPIGGEWFWSRDSEGNINQKDDKAGFWKCPYHNGRMCLEIMERIAHTNDA